jgi:hypothetical protein
MTESNKCSVWIESISLVVFANPKLPYLVIRKDSTERAHQPPRIPIPSIQVREIVTAA